MLFVTCPNSQLNAINSHIMMQSKTFSAHSLIIFFVLFLFTNRKKNPGVLLSSSCCPLVERISRWFSPLPPAMLFLNMLQKGSERDFILRVISISSMWRSTWPSVCICTLPRQHSCCSNQKKADSMFTNCVESVHHNTPL